MWLLPFPCALSLLRLLSGWFYSEPLAAVGTSAQEQGQCVTNDEQFYFCISKYISSFLSVG